MPKSRSRAKTPPEEEGDWPVLYSEDPQKVPNDPPNTHLESGSRTHEDLVLHKLVMDRSKG